MIERRFGTFSLSFTHTLSSSIDQNRHYTSFLIIRHMLRCERCGRVVHRDYNSNRNTKKDLESFVNNGHRATYLTHQGNSTRKNDVVFQERIENLERRRLERSWRRSKRLRLQNTSIGSLCIELNRGDLNLRVAINTGTSVSIKKIRLQQRCVKFGFLVPWKILRVRFDAKDSSFDFDLKHREFRKFYLWYRHRNFSFRREDFAKQKMPPTTQPSKQVVPLRIRCNDSPSSSSSSARKDWMGYFRFKCSPHGAGDDCWYELRTRISRLYISGGILLKACF